MSDGPHANQTTVGDRQRATTERRAGNELLTMGAAASITTESTTLIALDGAGGGPRLARDRPVAVAFAAATLATMTAVVLAGRLGAHRLPDGSWQRWSHAAAGLVIALCGLAIQVGP